MPVDGVFHHLPILILHLRLLVGTRGSRRITRRFTNSAGIEWKPAGRTFQFINQKMSNVPLGCVDNAIKIRVVRHGSRKPQHGFARVFDAGSFEACGFAFATASNPISVPCARVGMHWIATACHVLDASLHNFKRLGLLHEHLNFSVRIRCSSSSSSSSSFSFCRSLRW